MGGAELEIHLETVLYTRVEQNVVMGICRRVTARANVYRNVEGVMEDRQRKGALLVYYLGIHV